MIDNRRSERHIASAKAYAALIAPSNPITIGHIIDISADGASVRYIAEKPTQIGVSYINLFTNQTNFVNSKRIQCNIVYDIPIGESSWYDFLVRRCGVQFEQFTPEGRRVLKTFIEQYIIEST